MIRLKHFGCTILLVRNITDIMPPRYFKLPPIKEYYNAPQVKLTQEELASLYATIDQKLPPRQSWDVSLEFFF